MTPERNRGVGGNFMSTRCQAAFILLGLVAGLGSPLMDEARGQQRMMIVRGGPGGAAGAGQVSRRSVDRYAELLGLTTEQKETAGTMHEGYAAALDQAQKARREAVEELRRSADDTGDHSVFMERMPRIQSDFRDASEKLERAFFEDLRAILESVQEPKWSSVERMRRREVGLRGATLSGEGVDLVEVLETLKLDEGVRQELVPAVEEYEAELDRALEAKGAAAKETNFVPRGNPAEDEKMLEAVQEAMAATKEAGKRVQEINVTHARKMEAMLPEDARAAFEGELKRRSFPKVYRQSAVGRDLAGALELSDLSEEQRESLANAKAQYEREAAAANERWARAIREAEASANEGAVATGMGMMRISMGDEPAGLVEARKARREVDEKAAERVKSILTPAQREKLPKAPLEREEGAMFEAATMVVETR